MFGFQFPEQGPHGTLLHCSDVYALPCVIILPHLMASSCTV